MARELEPRSGSSVSLGKKAVAGLVLVIAAYVLFKVVIGLITAIALPIVAILAVVGIVWAWRVIR